MDFRAASVPLGGTPLLERGILSWSRVLSGRTGNTGTVITVDAPERRVRSGVLALLALLTATGILVALVYSGLHPARGPSQTGTTSVSKK